MSKALFNTLEATEILADAGIEDRKAQAVVKMTHEAISQGVATKGDVVELVGRFDTLETKIDDVEKRLETKIDDVEKRLETKIDDVEKRLETKIDDVEKRLETKIDDVEKRLDTKIDKMANLVNERFNKTDAKIIELGQEIVELGRRISGGHFWFVGMILTVAGALFGATIALHVMGN